VRTRHVLIIDLVLIASAALGAFILRFDLGWVSRAREQVVPFLMTAVVIKPAALSVLGLYRSVWRYTGLRDLALLGVGVASSSAAMTAVVLVTMMAGRMPSFSKAVLAVDALLTFGLLATARIAVRLTAEAGVGERPPRLRRRVVVVGAGDSGVALVGELRRNRALGLEPVAFLDDHADKVGKAICGLPVAGQTGEVPRAVEAFDADEVIIAMPRASGQVLRQVHEACREARVRVRTVPGLFELLNDEVSVGGLRPVEVADLLRRPQVVSDPPVHGYLAGRRVLVTGAGGSIGRELCRQVAFAAPASLVLVGHGENSIFEAHLELSAAFPRVALEPVIADVRDAARMAEVFGEFRPEIVFHAAAYKHVPLMERHPVEVVSNNVLGTAVVVDAAVDAGVSRLVLVSTDKAVSPHGLMGATKRLAEAVVRHAGRRYERGFVVVRFGNVLGSRGSALEVFTRQIARGGPVTITDPGMRRYFMTIPEAVHLAVQAGGLGRGGELFVLDMGEPVALVDLVGDLITLSGADPSEIPVLVTGRRPGEKIEEALWQPGAEVSRTAAEDVLLVTEPDERPAFDVDVAVGQLADAVARGDRRRIQAVLTRVVPSYTPQLVQPASLSAAVRRPRAAGGRVH
jgi:FlaA1/EpsC-like NDP-sugar epimerase